LQRLVEAMKPGYSKILVVDFVLPDVGAPLAPSLLDINMLALLNGMERTEGQWRDLFGSVGLEIVKIWDKDKDKEAVIEVQLLDMAE